MFSYKRGTDPVRTMLAIVMVYTFYCYWSESTANLVHRDKIADQDRKIAAYRLSRDDELKNAVVLETRQSGALSLVEILEILEPY